MGTWRAFFSWPSGGVWANLLASLLWGAPAFVAHHVLMRRHTTREIERVAGWQTKELKEHMGLVADGPVRAGAGGNPAAAGLTAERPAVPPTGAAGGAL